MARVCKGVFSICQTCLWLLQVILGRVLSSVSFSPHNVTVCTLKNVCAVINDMGNATVDAIEPDI